MFDGTLRLVAVGFQVASGKIACDNDGRPMIADMFDDPAFALARHEAVGYAAMLRRMGEFEPARLDLKRGSIRRCSRFFRNLRYGLSQPNVG